MSRLRTALLVLPAVLMIAVSGASDARAACYEIIGCTDADLYRERDLLRMSCQILGDVRNAIYAENRYCFRKLEYQRMFGNRDCRYTSAGAVPLNRLERVNVAVIRRAERINGCSVD